MFNWSDSDFSLNLSVIDDTHKEFIELYNIIIIADDAVFAEIFDIFFSHTEKHFANENKLMDQSNFPAISEHKGEHQRVLNELNYFKSKVQENKFSFARFYIKDRIPLWFKLHLATMDSALAAHLKKADINQLLHKIS
jgi:hemerythrin-like metal-binding protein